MKILIITIPLISAIAILIIGRKIGTKGGEIISKTSIIISGIISIIALKENIEGEIKAIEIKEWFKIERLIGKMEIIYDKETIIMINLISIVTLCVIYYSYWYLKEEAHINRFISLLLIFSVTMYILVASKNYIFSFLGWEGVGIISFLLINYWSNSIENSKSALKAVIFNKVGDIFYILAMVMMNNLDYYSNLSSKFSSFLLLFLLLAAMAKSAQIFFQCWLGDAMAGPTPVSALLHAATMVTAGIFIIIRSKILLYNEGFINYNNIIIIIGSLTILFALGIYQPYNSSLYNLLTHGFFKALLFLAAGLLIHSFLFEQDLRKFGNFLFKSPLFYLFFLIGTLAIIAFPTMSGFYSKELILLHSLTESYYYYILLLLGSFLSSLYSFKILYFSFFKNNSYPSLSSFHSLSGSISFLYPISFLIFGSIFLGYLSFDYFASPEYLNLSFESSLNSSSIFLKSFSILLPLLALLLLSFSSSLSPFNLFFKSFFPILSLKFFFDNFYNYFIVRFFFLFSYHLSFKSLDRGFLEYLGPVSFFRLFFFFPKNYNLYNQSYSNSSFLFFYFFLSLLLLLLSFFFFLPFPLSLV